MLYFKIIFTTYLNIFFSLKKKREKKINDSKIAPQEKSFSAWTLRIPATWEISNPKQTREWSLLQSINLSEGFPLSHSWSERRKKERENEHWEEREGREKKRGGGQYGMIIDVSKKRVFIPFLISIFWDCASLRRGREIEAKGERNREGDGY